MRVTLEFDLPQEANELRAALAAGDLVLAIQDLDQWLRGELKYEGREELNTEEVRRRMRTALGGLEWVLA